MVVTLAPSFMTASVRQELIRRPSTSTVHAPHWPWSQPFLVPVRSRWSRSASSSVVHGATSSLTGLRLTLSDTGILSGTASIRPVEAAVPERAIAFLHLFCAAEPGLQGWFRAFDNQFD